MSVIVNQETAAIEHRCRKCKCSIVLPEWVSQKEDFDSVSFKCPECEHEAEVNISEYPRVGVRVVVDGWNDSIYAQGGS